MNTLDMGKHVYTTGFVVGRIADVVLITLLLVGVGVGAWFIKRPPKKRYFGMTDEGIAPWDHRASGIAFIAICGFLLLITPLMYFPYDMDYHARREVSGTVARVDSRILSEGEGFEEKIVITFDGSNIQFGCKDTRCASLREGDWVQLLCTKDYDWNSTDGWNCGWGRSEQG